MGIADAVLAQTETRRQTRIARTATRLAVLGQHSRSTAAARANLVYADSRAGQFIESWADLTAWGSATTVQVSGGKVYGNGTTGGASGASHGISLASGATFRAVTTVVTPATSAASGGIMVGFGKGSAGSFGGSGSTLRGLYFSFSANLVQICDNGSFSTPVVSVAANLPQTWTVTLTADANYFSVVAVTSDGVNEVRGRWARDQTNFPLNNLSIFNSDSRQLSGGYIGKFGAVFALSTITPRTSIEDVNRTVHWTGSGTSSWKVSLPAGYDPRLPSPVAICFHGNGSDEHIMADNSNGRNIALPLLTAGYIVVTAATTTATSTWGAQGSLDAYTAAYRWTAANFNIGPVVFYANSMGGIESLLVLAERKIPGVAAWVGTSPTVDLANNYANATFTSTIRTAYGIASDGSDYATKTVGHDPALKTGDSFQSLPMLILAATDDTTVTKVANGDKLASLVAQYSDELVSTSGITGGHSFNFATYATQVIAFFDKYAAA